MSMAGSLLTRPKEPNMKEILFTVEEFTVVIYPDNPITVCELYWWNDRLIAYGLGVCKHGDTYDRETGSRMALRAALKHAELSDTDHIWTAYLAIFPVSERKQAQRVCTSVKETAGIRPKLTIDYGQERVKALYTDPGLVYCIDIHEILKKFLLGNNPLGHCYREKVRGWRGMWDEEMTWKL